MNDHTKPAIAIAACDAPERTVKSIYPEPFASRMSGRTKQPLGDLFGIKNFGVNLTTLAPGGESALLHKHKSQEEFIYILQGHPTLVTDEGEVLLHAGMCAGFTAQGAAHHLLNRTNEQVVYLEVGDRTAGDKVTYPADDLMADFVDGKWRFSHKDGTAY